MVNSSELIKDFVNTLHKDPQLAADEEELATPGDLVAWLGVRGLPVDGATAHDLGRACELREALRTLLLANNGEDVDVTAAYAVLDRTARKAHVELCCTNRGPALV